MTKKQGTNVWTGIRGRLGAWYFNSPLRRLSEILFFGDVKSAFLNEVSPVIQGNKVVLDIGAGSGYYSLAIAKKMSAGKIICLDSSEEMLQSLEQKAEKKDLKDRIQILKGEASSSGLANESVDLVVSNGLLHELSNPEAVLREMHRVLRPNGWVIVTDFRSTRITNLIEATHSKDAHGPFSVEELEKLFAKVGLSNVRVNPVRHWVIGVCKK